MPARHGSIYRNCKDEIIIEEDGTASFPVMGESKRMGHT